MNLKIKNCLLFVYLVLLSFTAAYGQNIIYVATTGSDSAGNGTKENPYQTLRYAHNQSSDGDIIELAGGTYNVATNYDGTSGISIQRNHLTIRSAPGEVAHITRPATGPASTIFKYYGATTGGRLERLEISGGYYGVHLSSDWSLISPDAGNPAPGVEDRVKASTGVQIVNCYIHHTGRDAIKSSAGCDDLLVKGCHIAFTGITDSSNCDGVDIVNADRVKVQECYIHDIPTRGAYAKGGSRDVIFENNLIVNTGGGLAAGFFSDQNLFDSTNTQFYESIDCIIRNNILINTGYIGIESQQSTGLKVYNNTIIGAARGIRLSSNTEIAVQRGSENVEIKNNIFMNLTHSSNQVLVDLGVLGTPLAEVVMDNNLFFGGSGGPNFNLGGTNYSLSTWRAAGKDTNSISGSNPLLDANYHLTASSPAISMGADLGVYNYIDYDGDVRSGSFDIGADQYVTGTALQTPPPAGINGTGLVLSIPVPPEVSPASIHEDINVNTTRTVTLTATPMEGGSISFFPGNLPAFGSLVDNGNNTATLTFNPTAAGPLGSTGTILVLESMGGSVAVPFSINVTGVNSDIVNVTAWHWDTNEGAVPANTIDLDLTTRWSGAEIGTWIKYEFDDPKLFKMISIAFFRSSLGRIYYFDVEVSDDNVNWTFVSTHSSVSGDDTVFQHFDIPDSVGRYLRIVNKGNSQGGDNWASYLEVAIDRESWEEPGMEWHGHAVDEYGNADTGWLGWIHVLNDPYIWQYSTGGWFYVPSVDENGAWMYSFR